MDSFFLNPDGTLVVELQNRQDKNRTVRIAAGGRWFQVEMPPRSWSTVVLPPEE